MNTNPKPNTHYTLPSGSVVKVIALGITNAKCVYVNEDGGLDVTVEFLAKYAK